MVFVMDKMKDHSCAIQPAFGLGIGGGLNGLNFALMMDQMLNPDNFPPLVDDDDVQLEAIVFPQLNPANFPFNVTNLPPFDPLNFNPTNQQLQPLATEQSNQATGNQQPLPSVTDLVNNAIQQHIVVEQINQVTGNQPPIPSVADLVSNAFQHHIAAEQSNQTTGNQPPLPTVADLVNNAIQHHIATHHALLNNATGTTGSGSNNVQPQLNVAGLMQNALQEQFASTPLQPLPMPIPVAVQLNLPENLPTSASADQPQLLISLPSNNGFGLQQYFIGPGQPPPLNVSDINLDIHLPTANPDLQLPTTPELPNFILNNVQETIHSDEDSNSSVPPTQAPFSSPAYPFSPSDLNASNEYEPSVASNIIIIDSAQNSEDVDENQSNHINVPN